MLYKDCVCDFAHAIRDRQMSTTFDWLKPERQFDHTNKNETSKSASTISISHQASTLSGLCSNSTWEDSMADLLSSSLDLMESPPEMQRSSVVVAPVALYKGTRRVFETFTLGTQQLDRSSTWEYQSYFSVIRETVKTKIGGIDLFPKCYIILNPFLKVNNAVLSMCARLFNQV